MAVVHADKEETDLLRRISRTSKAIGGFRLQAPLKPNRVPAKGPPLYTFPKS